MDSVYTECGNDITTSYYSRKISAVSSLCNVHITKIKPSSDFRVLATGNYAVFHILNKIPSAMYFPPLRCLHILQGIDSVVLDILILDV